MYNYKLFFMTFKVNNPDFYISYNFEFQLNQLKTRRVFAGQKYDYRCIFNNIFNLILGINFSYSQYVYISMHVYTVQVLELICKVLELVGIYIHLCTKYQLLVFLPLEINKNPNPSPNLTLYFLTLILIADYQLKLPRRHLTLQLE